LFGFDDANICEMNFKIIKINKVWSKMLFLISILILSLFANANANSNRQQFIYNELPWDSLSVTWGTFSSLPYTESEAKSNGWYKN